MAIIIKYIKYLVILTFIYILYSKNVNKNKKPIKKKLKLINAIYHYIKQLKR